MPLCVFPKCFIPSFLQHGPYTIEGWIREVAHTVKADGVELYGPALPSEDSAKAELAKIARDLGLEIPMYCHTPDFTQPDPAERRREVESQKRAIETCSRLGIQYCRVLSGQRRPGLGWAEGLDLAAECINALVPYAADRGVCLILENHYKDAHWNFPEFAQKREHFRGLLDRIPSSPYFGVNFDPSNALVPGDDPVDFLKEFMPRVRTMHASDRFLVSGTLDDLRKTDADGKPGYASNLRHGVIGEGLIDYESIFQILQAHRFQGWISIENGNDPEKGILHMQQSAVFLRRMMQTHEIS